MSKINSGTYLHTPIKVIFRHIYSSWYNLKCMHIYTYYARVFNNKGQI